MADGSAIEWTDATWNPVTGCTKITAGCANCYAARFSERFRGVTGHPFERGFDLTLRPDRILQPLSWRRPRMIFVNSMSDLFHKEIPREFIDRVFDTMEAASWHVFQVPTKRIKHLQQAPASIRFLSIEPLIGPVGTMDLAGIHWVIAGGESGPNARPMNIDWARDIRDQCAKSGIAFFFKQWGGIRPKSGGRALDGREWNELPNISPSKEAA